MAGLIFLTLGFGTAAHAAADHLLISRIQTSGTTAGDEFLEVYNPTTATIDLSALPLKLHIRTSTGTESNKALTFINSTIAAKGSFLIGPITGYAGSIPLDATYAASGNTLVSNGGVYISKNTTASVDIIDKVGWGSQPAGGFEGSVYPDSPIANQRLERKSSGEDFYDTDNNAADFSLNPPSTNLNKNSSSNQASTNINASNNTNTVANTNSSASSLSVLTAIIFNEVYPNPPDENNEFIELKNASGFSGTAAGWRIKDASDSEFALPDKEIAAGALWAIPKIESKISLNNDGETLTLMSPDGLIAAVLSIPAAPESQSYSRSGESFEWTSTITAGAENIFTQTETGNSQNTFSSAVNANTSQESVNANVSSGSINANSANNNSFKISADFSAIKLSELMPNPTGDDRTGEWIELYNNGGKEIDLAGGSLSDASGKKYAFPENTRIAAKSYKTFNRKITGIILNNDSDTIVLKDALEKNIDRVSYENGTEGKSYALLGGEWSWTDPTPEKAGASTADNENINENLNTNSAPRIGLTINEVKNSKTKNQITVSGTVTAVLGEIAKNTFYIQDDTGGIAVVLENGGLKISRGDFTAVKGKIKTVSGEKILSAADANQITIQSSGSQVQAWQMNIADIGSQSLGLFAGISGRAVEANAKGFIIDDGSGSIAVLAPENTAAENGQMISVRGILKKTKDGTALILRDKDDFISGNVLGENDQKILNAAAGKKFDMIIQLLIIVITALLGGLIARKYLQKYVYATQNTRPAEEPEKNRDNGSGFGI